MADSPERDPIHRDIDTDATEPTVEIVEAVADIEGKDTTDLTNMWECTNHVIDHLFSHPPSPEADMKVEFSYEGYRITVTQDGSALFERIT